MTEQLPCPHSRPSWTMCPHCNGVNAQAIVSTKPPVLRDSLREELAALEHHRWARWQSYLHSKCNINQDGSLTIPAELVERWEHQMATPYAMLSDAEKDSDRRQVDEYLPLVKEAYAIPPQVLDLMDQLGCMGIAWDGGLAEAALAAQDKVYALMADSEVDQCVGDLLAVAHGDGGHYLQEHGLAKACKDAEKVVTDLRMEVAAWKESHDILVHSEDPW